MGLLGDALVLFIGARLYENYASSSPFTMLGCFFLFLSVFLVIMVKAGFYGNFKKRDGEEETRSIINDNDSKFEISTKIN
jgi:hypothetical protein